MVLFILILAAGLGWITGSLVWALFSALVLFLSLESFFLPTHYELAAEEVVVRRIFSRSRRPWGSFRAVYSDAHGLTLSPYERRSALEPFRALRLLFDGGDRGRIRAAVRDGTAPEARWIETSSRRDGAGDEATAIRDRD